MATRGTPSRPNADDLSGSLPQLVTIADTWDTFHIGTDHDEPTSHAQCTSAGYSPTAKPIGQFLVLDGESIYEYSAVSTLPLEVLSDK